MPELESKDVIDATYTKLSIKHSNVPVKFEESISLVIASDSDWHRSRYGCMIYREAKIFSFNNKRWAIFYGNQTSGYPANGYLRDLTAIKIDEKFHNPDDVRIWLAERLRGSSGFKDSLLYADRSGDLVTDSDSVFFPFMLPFHQGISKLIASEKILNRDGLVFMAILEKPRTYKPDIVRKLTQTIEEILGAN